MKTTTKRTAIAAVSIFGLATIILLSSFIAFKGQRLRNFGKNNEVTAYVKNNILPVLKEKREFFDQYLSNEEKQTIVDLQQRLSALRSERKEILDQRLSQNNWKNGERPELTDEQREFMRAHIKEKRLIMTEAWSIADNHEQEIESILEDLKPDMDKWREDMWDIMAPYREERQRERDEWRENHRQGNNEFRGEGRRGGFGRGYGGRGNGMGMGIGMGGQGPGICMQYASPPLFILFDADKALEMLEDIGSRAATVFPNPTDDKAIIKFELIDSEVVTVKIYDNQGNLIETSLNEQKAAGEHEISVNVSEYDSGLYFYEISSKSLSQKGRLIKR